MRYGLGLCLLFLCLFVTREVFAIEGETPRVSMIGLDESGLPVEGAISADLLKSNIVRAARQLQESGLKAIENQANPLGSQAKVGVSRSRDEKNRVWTLREILIGISVRIKVGWDKVINADFVPGFRLISTPKPVTANQSGGVQ